MKKYKNEKTGEVVTVYPWSSTEIKIKVNGKDWLQEFTE